MMYKWLFSIMGIGMLLSCTSGKKSVQLEISIAKHRADSIAQAVQKELILNLTRAIEKGGTAYAVDFCNTQAMSLTDSMSKQYGVRVQRISGKNRNLANVLKTPNDHAFYTLFSEQAQLKDTIIQEDNQMVYYKRIHIAMPTCLGCHGDPQKDIDPETLRKIQLFYPYDLAKGYTLNDFRALWKITYPEE